VGRFVVLAYAPHTGEPPNATTPAADESRVSTPAPTHVPTTNGTAGGSGERRLGPDIHAIVRACREEGRVRMVFQPIVDLRTGAMCGFEALARFPMYRPDEWFRAATDSGMSGWFETTILQTALKSLPDLPDGCFMSVNMSPEAIQSPEARSAFADYESLEQVVIEITGRVDADDAAAVADALQPARSRGARVSVDESGRGGTCLISLAALEPDFLKLERSLVAGIDAAPELEKAVRAALALAGHLEAEVVAQGIETEGEIETIVGLGVPYGQGFAFGHALPQLMAHAHRHEQTIKRLSA
jgi:EAL domain-containing protein (putative c-di-GMP-specific phosphodiesterase class I)